MKKRRPELFSFYDRTGIIAHLEAMAAKGWMLEKITPLFWQYRKIVPQKLHFSVSYYPKASGYDPEPGEELEVYRDYGEAASWRFVCSSAQMQIFCTEDRDPVPMQTEPLTEVETIHAAAKRSFLQSYWMLLVVGLLQAVMFIGRMGTNWVRMLADPVSICVGVSFTGLLVLCGAELTGYYRWRRKALAAARQGIFLETHGHQKLAAVILVLVTAGLIYWLGNVFASADRLMKLICIAMLGYTVILMLIVNGVRRFLQRRKVSAKRNFALTLTVDCVLAFAMMAAVVFGILRASQSGILDSPEIAQQPWIVLSEITSEPCTQEESHTESFLLEYDVCRQWAHPAGIEYTLVRVKLPLLYEACKNRFVSAANRTPVPLPGTVLVDRRYDEIDPAPWNAQQAYMLQGATEADGEKYLLCYADTIVELCLYGQLNSEQVAQNLQEVG